MQQHSHYKYLYCVFIFKLACASGALHRTMLADRLSKMIPILFKTAILKILKKDDINEI